MDPSAAATSVTPSEEDAILCQDLPGAVDSAQVAPELVERQIGPIAVASPPTAAANLVPSDEPATAFQFAFGAVVSIQFWTWPPDTLPSRRWNLDNPGLTPARCRTRWSGRTRTIFLRASVLRGGRSARGLWWYAAATALTTTPPCTTTSPVTWRSSRRSRSLSLSPPQRCPWMCPWPNTSRTFRDRISSPIPTP